MKTLYKAIPDDNRNNLNAIRLVLAFVVIVSHSYPICYGPFGERLGEWMYVLTNGQETFGSVAVDLFFLISGLLITASCLRSKTVSDYLLRRVLRIYPGFIVAVSFSALIIWVFSPEFRSSMTTLNWVKHYVNDLLFLGRDSLVGNGIFSSNPYMNAGNGSLWTIPIEFMCYLGLLVPAVLCLFRWRWGMLILTVGLWLVYSAKLLRGGGDVFAFSGGNLHFAVFFLAGVTTWLWRDKIPFSGVMAFVAALALGIASQFRPWFSILFPFVSGFVVWWIAYGPKISGSQWTQKTDLSYGVYLYAFPVQQTVALLAPRKPWVNILIATPIIVALAWCSWHCVEKRFLALKKYRLHDYDPAISAPFRDAKN